MSSLELELGSEDTDAGRLSCPSHSSRFDAVTGKVLAGPATKALHRWPFSVRGDTLVVHAPDGG